MPRPERPVDPGEGPAQRFAVALRQLRQSAGNPGYRVLAKRAHYSVTTLADAAAGERLPTLAVALAYVRACDGDESEWTARWRAAAAEVDAASLQVVSSSDPGEGRPPYLGLAAYGPEDAERFCGRDSVTAALKDRLTRQRFVAVVGASGSGKSSLVRAGLVPAAHAQADRWSTVLFTPGAHPMQECAEHLAARLSRDPAVLAAELAADPYQLGQVLAQLLPEEYPQAQCLLIVDQFEEVFSLCEDVSEREIFIRALLAAAHAPDSRTRVVIGLRADFYAHCARLPELAAALQDAQLLVGPMTPQELSVAITEPAARAGLMVEKALVATIIAEAASRPAALPFVSHALWETWRRRRGTGLFLAGYQAAGGLDGAIAQSAEQVYGELDEQHRRAARRILLRLTALGDTTEDTRRRVSHTELGDDPITTRVLQRLAAARLVTVGEHTVEIAHEALISGWPTLREWLAADRESLRAQRRLTVAAADWAAHGYDEVFLYRGSLLAGWADRDTEALNETERDFLAAGVARQAREHSRHRRRLHMTIGGLAAGLVTVSLLAFLAVVQTFDARTQRDLAIASSLAAQSRAVLSARPDLANLLALAGLDHAVTAQTVASAEAALSTPMHVARPLVGHSGAVTAVAFSPNGHHAATGGGDGTVRLWNTASTEPLTAFANGGGVNAVAFNADGSILATGGADGVVRLWDTNTSRLMGTLIGHAAVDSMAFNQDGKIIASGNADGTTSIWDTGTRRLLTTLAGHKGHVHSVAFSPTGRTLATAGQDYTVRLWDPITYQTKAILHGHTGEVYTTAFSPDGKTLATGSADGKVYLRDTDTSQIIATLAGHTRTVQAVAFAADGRTIVTASWDGTARIWNTATQQILATLTGHTDQVFAVAVNPDNASILTGSKDGTARLWDSNASQTIATLKAHTDYIDAIAFSPHGRTVATGSRDGTARLWDTANGTPVAVLDADAGFVLTVAFSPDGNMLATGHADGTIRLWNNDTHQQIASLPGHLDGVASVTFSADGRLMASASKDSTARLWNLTTLQPVTVLHGHQEKQWVIAAAFSPDGSTIATASTDGTARLWDTHTGETIRVLNPNAGFMTALAFGPDGKILATATGDGTALLWDLASSQVTATLSGHTNVVTSIAFNPDGRSIATSSRDDTTRLWDLRSHQTIVELTQHIAWVTAVAFSPHGKTLATTSWDKTVRLTPALSAWPSELCRRAGRNLTMSEWTFYIGSKPYRRLCSDLPSGQGADPAAPALVLPSLQ